ncbi:MAG: VWA domain-containing protein [Bacteroidales bacterium]|nr:VWA domain-containing protein [Bacteroidales bacterium]MCF8457903.1 VWA domain-containing protein [Bacteroidales bacterium]
MSYRIINYLFLTCLALFVISCEKSEIADTTSPDSSELYTTDGIGGGPGSTGEPNGGTGQYEPGQMTAGEWNDLQNWAFWLGLMQENDWHPLQAYWGFHTQDRYSVEIVDANDKAVVDAHVSLLGTNDVVLWKARTDNKGRAELFGKMYDEGENPNKIKVSYKGTESYLNPLVMMPAGVNTFSLSVLATIPQKMNIYFAVDATGSMGDEIEYLKAELGDVISTVQSQFSNLDLLMGTAFYRDEGDAYLIEELPFTTNINSVLGFVEDHSAGGGGDFPEAVHTALETSLNAQWEEEAISRILFLILDAPPHYENQVLENVRESVKLAAEKGIKIIPITASGIDKETEFLMRFMAISTNSTYTFITNDSGIGGEHLEPTVGQYTVELLNEMIIRIISENCEY